MSTVKQNLIAARALIENPVHWMRHGYSDTGTNIHRATCFCATGALMRAASYDYREVFDTPEYAVLSVAAKTLTRGSNANAVSLNDTKSHETVLSMFDKAIASCS